jgi:uncharacterized paraquat-inducible protein A
MAAATEQRHRPGMSLFKRKKETDQRMAPCPKCLQMVPADALDCPVCGADLRERPPTVSAQLR